MDRNIVEYKNLYSDSIAKTICAFLNSNGGRIVIHFDRLPASDSYIVLRGRILEDLENKLWAFAIDENGEMKDVKTSNPNVVVSCVNYLFLEEDDRSLKMLVTVDKPNTDDVFFCVKRRIKNTKGMKEEEKTRQNTAENFVFDFYFRISDRNVKPDNTQLNYLKKIKYYGFPIIRDYEPSDYSTKKDFVRNREENKVEYKVIGELPHSNYLYKYMDLESALLSMKRTVQGRKVEKKPNIRFVEPTSWDDQYEGRFYNACYKSKGGIEISPTITPFLYACCFSSKRENEAAWVLYSHNRTGLASRCVEFTLNRKKLREELVKNQKNCSLYIGAVQYLSKEKIDRVHQETIDKNNQPNEDYDKFFNSFSLECYLNLLLLKRMAFEHEREVRIFIIPNDEKCNPKTRRGEDGIFPKDVKPRSIFVDIDWIEVINEVRIDKNCTEYERNLLQNSLYELAKLKKKENKMGKDEYKKLLDKLQLKEFDPYKDDSLSQGPITIMTNQK